ncbi:zinc-binding alcohol dehydrogenase [Byssothecium circinans]|uniref:alcohol dehydrogenase (NADP(+)) n=1 Tax=Byssothecium circinans TaxID=147558 RepID=A0A6A5U7K5_9PLEO|nr:zinc-binding alcohol dehydrogenase [Byssothecium circinans]
MACSYRFEGWFGLGESAVNGNLVWRAFEPKTWEETDVDIQVSHCGVCMSDVHTLQSGWRPTQYPVLVGHEIVGKVVKVGSLVHHVQVGDRVGVGAVSGSCANQKGDCEACADGQEQHCKHVVDTYDSQWPVDGSTSKGGYATYWRGMGRWVVLIPGSLPSDIAAPMLCGGITAFAPLMKHGAGAGKSVGIIGLGGLGHFAVMGARALGCNRVTVVSRTSTKKADAMQMGASDFIATAEDSDWAVQHADSLDIIVSTVSSASVPLQDYLGMLKYNGKFIQVGAPEGVLPGFNAFDLITKPASIWGSNTGSVADIQRMLNLFGEKNVRSWVSNMPMQDANRAVVDLRAGKARYRYVLCTESQDGDGLAK